MAKRATETTEPNEPGLTGPADTAYGTQQVSTTTPRPEGTDLLTGTTQGVTEMPDRPAFVEPLRLVEEERWETYDLVSPSGEICVVTRSMDTGEHIVQHTGRYVTSSVDAVVPTAT